MCDSRPPRCTGQMTLGTAPMMVLGRRSSTRVQNRWREPASYGLRTSDIPIGSDTGTVLRTDRRSVVDRSLDLARVGEHLLQWYRLPTLTLRDRIEEHVLMETAVLAAAADDRQLG